MRAGTPPSTANRSGAGVCTLTRDPCPEVMSLLKQNDGCRRAGWRLDCRLGLTPPGARGLPDRADEAALAPADADRGWGGRLRRWNELESGPGRHRLTGPGRHRLTGRGRHRVTGLGRH